MRELSLSIMDVAQNSITAGATLIEVELREDTAAGTLLVAVTDNGCGMSEETLRKVQSPFYTTRTTRPVGLGIPLFKMACEMTGGSFSIASRLGEGTRVEALFMTGHIDMTPVGAIGETMLLLISCNPQLDFVFTHARGGREETLDTRELRAQLKDVPLNSPEVVGWIKEYLSEMEEAVLTSPPNN